ncbi:DUF397 domain-containing protein [Streptomyces sp. NPDC056796]|uniref:DUF397 domain-containing protein n=1 Tax=unclassified Streptomyces TaxID=2593676 RepID=UPI0036758FFD
MTERTISTASAPTGWRKSSYSDNQGGSCIEILDGHPSGVPVRDSKVPHGPTLIVAATGWSAFVSAVRSGHFSA